MKKQINPRKKWFTSKAEAKAALEQKRVNNHDYLPGIYKGVRGSRHPGQYFVGSYLEFINAYWQKKFTQTLS